MKVTRAQLEEIERRAFVAGKEPACYWLEQCGRAFADAVKLRDGFWSEADQIRRELEAREREEAHGKDPKVKAFVDYLKGNLEQRRKRVAGRPGYDKYGKKIVRK